MPKIPQIGFEVKPQPQAIFVHFEFTLELTNCHELHVKNYEIEAKIHYIKYVISLFTGPKLLRG